MKTQITPNANGFHIFVMLDGATIGTGLDYLLCRDGQYRPTCGRCHGTGVYGACGTCFTCNGNRLARNKKAYPTAEDALAALVKSATAKARKADRKAAAEKAAAVAWMDANADLVEIVRNVEWSDYAWSDAFRYIYQTVENYGPVPSDGCTQWFRSYFASLLVTESPEAVDSPSWV